MLMFVSYVLYVLYIYTYVLYVLYVLYILYALYIPYVLYVLYILYVLCVYTVCTVCTVCIVHCRGKYGTVYKGRSKVSGQECAIKVIKKIKMDRKDVRREVRIIQKILDNPHRNIVRLMDWFETRREYVIVTEL